MTSDQISEARQTFFGCVYRNAQSSPAEIGRLYAHQVHDQKQLTTEVVKLMDAAFTVAMAESQDLRMQLSDQRLRADTAETKAADYLLAWGKCAELRDAAEQRNAILGEEVTSLTTRLNERDKLIEHIGSMIAKACSPNQKPEGESQSDYLQSCAAAERALAIKPPCQQPQAHPARCGCED